ncbi:hypothetical protein BCR39DRAFT_517869 [Naematelia encephala]|uniref:Uncharacterized protein n=1 Tax=Naematelia encephala TaxID=71784 RepID=A0A1Y2BHT5_9TREE|nr:hypothetical protein BCR39DRAFT_517869 [Naematelia encephala]
MVLYDTRKKYDFVNAGWIVHPDMAPKATIAQVQQRAERDLRDEVTRVGKGDEVGKALEAVRFMSGEQYVDQGTWVGEFTEKELDNWLWVKIDR